VVQEQGPEQQRQVEREAEQEVEQEPWQNQERDTQDLQQPPPNRNAFKVIQDQISTLIEGTEQLGELRSVSPQHQPATTDDSAIRRGSHIETPTGGSVSIPPRSLLGGCVSQA
jgi:hypothetical protein